MPLTWMHLEAIEEANKAFDIRLEAGFSSSLDELRNLNYPGFGNPEISISTKVSPVDGLKHDSAVLFNVQKGETDEQCLRLSEKYNGLGYQNLISMIFKLIRFRDEWMKVGKIAKNSTHVDRTFTYYSGGRTGSTFTCSSATSVYT